MDSSIVHNSCVLTRALQAAEFNGASLALRLLCVAIGLTSFECAWVGTLMLLAASFGLQLSAAARNEHDVSNLRRNNRVRANALHA
jgi:hypothetical protein